MGKDGHIHIHICNGSSGASGWPAITAALHPSINPPCTLHAVLNRSINQPLTQAAGQFNHRRPFRKKRRRSRACQRGKLMAPAELNGPALAFTVLGSTQIRVSVSSWPDAWKLPSLRRRTELTRAGAVLLILFPMESESARAGRLRWLLLAVVAIRCQDMSCERRLKRMSRRFSSVPRLAW